MWGWGWDWDWESRHVRKKNVFLFLSPLPSPPLTASLIYTVAVFFVFLFSYFPQSAVFFQGMTSLPARDDTPPISTLTKPQTKTRYSIYAAIITIVTNHYRPQRDARELDARKKLTRSLRFLIPSTVHFQ